MRLQLLALALLTNVSTPLLAQAVPASMSVNQRAIELFERDWVLMDWALRIHDPNRDAQLSLAEADTAARAFKQMADSDGDGRVTPNEYRRARDFLLARY